MTTKLRFQNGTSCSHSEASLANEEFIKRVEAGKEEVPGMKVEITLVDGTEYRGIYSPTKTRKMLGIRQRSRKTWRGSMSYLELDR